MISDRLHHFTSRLTIGSRIWRDIDLLLAETLRIGKLPYHSPHAWSSLVLSMARQVVREGDQILTQQPETATIEAYRYSLIRLIVKALLALAWVDHQIDEGVYGDIKA